MKKYTASLKMAAIAEQTVIINRTELCDILLDPIARFKENGDQAM